MKHILIALSHYDITIGFYSNKKVSNITQLTSKNFQKDRFDKIINIDAFGIEEKIIQGIHQYLVNLNKDHDKIFIGRTGQEREEVLSIVCDIKGVVNPQIHLERAGEFGLKYMAELISSMGE
jgi:hypothetical protein